MRFVPLEVPNVFFLQSKFLCKLLALLWFSKAADLVFIPATSFIQLYLKKSSSFYLGDLNFADYNKLILNLKLICGMNLLEKIPQSKVLSCFLNREIFFFRISLHPVNFSERLCIRILRKSFFSSDCSKLLSYKGLTLIGGRTCSGKTSLLYSYLSSFTGNAITLEDPVEFELPSISQTDVSLLGYREGIKSALRQNPDLICIGEIRDTESAFAAIRAALTGHNVIATVHINSPPQAFFRLKELQVNHLEQVLAAVIWVEDFQSKIFTLEDLKKKFSSVPDRT